MPTTIDNPRYVGPLLSNSDGSLSYIGLDGQVRALVGNVVNLHSPGNIGDITPGEVHATNYYGDGSNISNVAHGDDFDAGGDYSTNGLTAGYATNATTASTAIYDSLGNELAGLFDGTGFPAFDVTNLSGYAASVTVSYANYAYSPNSDADTFFFATGWGEPSFNGINIYNVAHGDNFNVDGNYSGNGLVAYAAQYSLAGNNLETPWDGSGNLHPRTVQTVLGIGLFGADAPDLQPAAPTDLAGVIEILQLFGFCEE